MKVKSLNALKAELEKRVAESLLDDVAEVVRENEIESIESIVYGTYSDPPVKYKRRRGNGGLSDPDNMPAFVNGTKMTMYNTTPPSYAYNEHNDEYHMERAPQGWRSAWYESSDDGCTIRYPVGLDELVEYGDGGPGGEYTHKHSTKPEGPTFLNPRPFTHATIAKLDINKQHVNALKYGLLRRGFKVKK